jgi:hypothetical protein
MVPTPVPGDVVRVRETYSPPTLIDAQLLAASDRWVVVLIHPELDERNPAQAGLRMPDDQDSSRGALAVPLTYLEVVDHLEQVDGFEEVSHGVWRKL